MIVTNDKLAGTLIGNNRGSVVADRAGSSFHEFVCSLSEACGNVPDNAQYVSMQINGITIKVKSASDVLTWVCRKMWITRMARLLPILRSRKYSWFKTDNFGMIRPLRISFNCYVDLDRFGATALSRAVQILEWSVPHKGVTITYRLPIEQMEPPPMVVPADVPKGELKDVPSDVLARTVLLEILKQGRDDGETWKDFMSAPRCRRELRLRNSLLHKLKPWEKKEEFAEEYSVLDDDADYMILSDLGWLDREGFLGWVQNIGISLEEVCSLLHVKLPNGSAPTISPSPVPEPQVPLGTLKSLILKNYPRGIVLNNATTALLEKEVGKQLDEFDLNRIRSEMFARADGTLLYPEMVMGMDGLERMKNRAKELLSEYGMFAYGCLWNEFAGEMRNLSEEKDFARFFDRFFRRDVGMVYAARDRLGKMMCLGEIQDVAETIGENVRGALAECGDAVSIDNLLVQLPYLSCEVIEHVGQEVLHDVIVFDVEGERYLKLLESYFLPDDFSHVVSDFVATTEASQGVVSIVLLEAEFESRYGEGFRVNYALEDESVFKQVVLMSFRGGEHSWRGDVFSATGIKVSRNVVDEFVKIRKGVFHEEEFFDFALEKRGLDNHASLVCQYLRTRCIRLNRTMWISVEDFRNRGILGASLREKVRTLLKEQLGTSALLHIGLIPEMALTSIPSMIIDGKEYSWNTYSLTSVAKHMINGLNIVNDEPSPYYVTAILLPDGVEVKKDGIVEHVFDICKESGMIPSSADMAFEYLKAKLVRMTKTQKLMRKINSYWRF